MPRVTLYVARVRCKFYAGTSSRLGSTQHELQEELRHRRAIRIFLPGINADHIAVLNGIRGGVEEFVGHGTVDL